MTMDLYDYGTPVNISAPPKSEVYDGSKLLSAAAAGAGASAGSGRRRRRPDAGARAPTAKPFGRRRPGTIQEARDARLAGSGARSSAWGSLEATQRRRDARLRDLRGTQRRVAAAQRGRAARGDLGGRRQRAPVGHAAAGQPEGLPALAVRRVGEHEQRARRVQGEAAARRGGAGARGARGGGAASAARSKRCSAAAACISSSTCAQQRAPRVARGGTAPARRGPCAR